MRSLICVLDATEEYSISKNILLQAGFEVKSAVASHDVNINYDIDLAAAPREKVVELTREFDMFALLGGYKMYYHLLGKKPPLKTWRLDVDIEKLDMLTTEFYRGGKVIVAPLAVPAYMAKLGLLKGRDATVYPTTELIKILRENQVNFVNKPVVKSGNFITIKNVETVGGKELLNIFRETT
ncbi:MAG: DJ-1/PfpI family protein [Pyrobaculum sp.]